MDDQQSRKQLLKSDHHHAADNQPKDVLSEVNGVVPTSSVTNAADVMKPGDVMKAPGSTSDSSFLPDLQAGLGSQVPSLNWKDVSLDREFICGWGAAFINITSTFPINKAIFRQQLQGISGFDAIKQLYGEGLRHLYRGLLPPLLQKTTTVSIMFGSYQKFRVHIDETFPVMPRPVNHAAAAVLAGTLEASLAPFERIQTLLQNQTYQKRFNNTWHAAKQLRSYGFREYYRGLTPILLRNGPSNVFFFLGREFLNSNMPELQAGSSRLAKDFICGACLGAMISTFFFPLNVVKTRMQSEVGGTFRSLRKTFDVVWEERGRSVKSLFRGYHLNYTRSFISWGIINASYEFLMQLFTKNKTAEPLQTPHIQAPTQQLAAPETVKWRQR